MKTIKIKVRKDTAEKWENVSPKLREHLNRSFEQQIDDLARQSAVASFDQLLKRISEQAAANGLTEEILQEILSEDD